MTRIAVVLIVVACSASLNACGVFGPSLAVPAASEFDRVVVFHGRLSPESTIIEDATAKEELVAFLTSLKHGWHKPWGTYPTPQYTIVLRTEHGPMGDMCVDLGENWIGKRVHWEYSGSKRIRSLSKSERAELMRIVKLPES